MKTSFGFALLGEDITIPLHENIRNTRIALYNSVTNLPNKLLLEKALDALIKQKNIIYTSLKTQPKLMEQNTKERKQDLFLI